MADLHNDPDIEIRLWNIARGEKDPTLEHHVASCDHCQQELSVLRQLLRYKLTAGVTFAEPPASLVTGLSGLMPKIRPDLVATRPSGIGQAVQRLRQITATLILDSGTTAQLAGVRSASDRRTRQFAFVSEAADLDLEVSSSDGSHLMAGQLGMDIVPAGLVILFVPADQDPLSETVVGAIEARISEDGYFSITLPAGEWVASVKIDDAVVMFPGVHL